MSAVDPAIRPGIEQTLQEAWPGATLRSLDVLEGGRSGITLAGHVDGGPAGSAELVFKVAPVGRKPVGRHDLTRQVRAMELARERGIIVPDIVFSAIEPINFYAMTRAQGEAVEPVLDAADLSLEPTLVENRALAAAEMLAGLHAIADVPTGHNGTPEPVADLTQELDRWARTAAAADHDILSGGEELAGLLANRLPALRPAEAFVHGDFRLGNVVFDGALPTGLIDWEIWGHTDPGIDVGWFLVFCNPDLFPGIGAPVVGMPTSEVLVQRYLDAGGRDIPTQASSEAFGRFKMAAIMAHNLKRHREGRHIDPFQEKLPPTISQLISSSIDLLN